MDKHTVHFQVEGKIASMRSSIENGWKRNEQKHDTEEEARHAASVFENASDVEATRIVKIEHKEEHKEKVISHE